MKDLILMQFLNFGQFGYNPEYENLTEEEKAYMDYVDECLYKKDENFSDACTRAMFLVLEILYKLDTEEELTDEEIATKKEEILKDFSKEEQEEIEMFMYACIQTIGIYSEERIQERREKKGKSLIKKLDKKKEY